jgi:hypothetical protein
MYQRISKKSHGYGAEYGILVYFSHPKVRRVDAFCGYHPARRGPRRNFNSKTGEGLALVLLVPNLLQMLGSHHMGVISNLKKRGEESLYAYCVH